MKIKQKKFLSGYRKFIVTDKDVKVTYGSILSVSEDSFPIFSLDSTYERLVNREIKYILLAALLFLPSLKFISDAISLSDTFPLRHAGVFIGASLISLCFYFRSSSDQIVFRSYGSREPQFVLWNKKPNDVEFNAFLSHLTGKIDSMKVNPNLSLEDKYKIYMNHLAFLHDEGVISEKEAEQIAKRQFAKMKKQNNVMSIVK